MKGTCLVNKEYFEKIEKQSELNKKRFIRACEYLVLNNVKYKTPGGWEDNDWQYKIEREINNV